MKKHPFTTVQISIEKLSAKGYGVGYVSKAPEAPPAKVEIPHTVPGDLLEVEIGRKRKGAYFGYFPKVIQASPDRAALQCVHAQSCGGCSWQQIEYQQQSYLKQKIVEELFSNLLSESTQFFPLIPCDPIWRYRNKMEYTFSQNKSGEKFLGLIMTGGKGRVFDLTECHLTDPWFSQVVCAVRSFWIQSSLQAYHMMSDKGALRNLTVRKARNTTDRLVMLTVSGNPAFAMKREEIHHFCQAVLSTLSDSEQARCSIFLRIQQIHKGSPTQFYEMHLHGPDHILEELHIPCVERTMTFKISPTAFFQPNSFQAEKLYNKALEMIGNKPLDLVLDLYAGTSTLGILFSAKARQVISIEINPHAVFDAEVNKELNECSNLTIHKGDVAEVLSKLREDLNFSAELVVVDPPRAGLDDRALNHIIQLSPKNILYVSCNPESQAKNVKQFMAAGYALMVVQPVDQFAHTIHIENICLLEKK